MAYTIYQYESVTPWGQPIEPPSSRTASQATGAAVRLDASTRYVAIVGLADTRIRISGDGSAATVADHLVLTDETRGFPIADTARPYVYGL